MKLTGLHILLTYQCNYECDHCFVWGSSRQSGTFTIEALTNVLNQAKEIPECESIYFEGGEPFLYYVPLQWGVSLASKLGFEVGIVSNGYWATSRKDALAWLTPFEGLVHSLSISSDLYHSDNEKSDLASNACWAAGELGISSGVISIARPDEALDSGVVGQVPEGESKVMYRGRAARQLTDPRSERPWLEFTECPHEDLRDPGRLHVDPLGNLHLCQGLVLGNIFEDSLKDICESYDPETHTAVSAILRGGPAELARMPGVVTRKGYADACHLCYETRDQLRAELPDVLGPAQMYGEV